MTKDFIITKAQIRILHTLKRTKGLDDDAYRDLIRQYSDERTESSKDLKMHEAKRLINALNPDTKSERVQREQQRHLVGRIYRRSCEIGFLNADYDSDDPVERKMNYAKLSKFLREKGVVKKDITQQNYDELLTTLKQLEAIARKLKKDDNRS